MVFPGKQHLGGRACLHGQLRAHRNGVAQSDRTLRGGGADAQVALAAEELGRFAGDVAQPGQHRAGGGQQSVFAGSRGQLGEPGAEDEASLEIATDQPVVFEGDRKPVGGRSSKPRRGHQTSEGGRALFECCEHQSCLVENANAT